MLTIEITDNFLMPFFDGTTKKKQWYECDMFRGEKIQFRDIVSAGNRTMLLVCLDGELARVLVDKCKVLECWVEGAKHTCYTDQQ